MVLKHMLAAERARTALADDWAATDSGLVCTSLVTVADGGVLGVMDSARFLDSLCRYVLHDGQ